MCTWYLILRAEHRIRTFENKMLSAEENFGPRREKVTRGCRKNFVMKIFIIYTLH